MTVTVSLEEDVRPPTGVGFGGPFLLITYPPDPSHWPRKETDGAPGIAQKSHWLLAA